MAGRGSVSSRKHVMSMAKNPLESKFGNALVRESLAQDRTLGFKFDTLDSELRRKKIHIEQAKKQFVKSRNLPEPILIVERAPSPDLKKRYRYRHEEGDGTDAYLWQQKYGEPHYMKTTEARSKTPKNFTTIDAFSVRRRRKVNLWEEGYTENKGLIFKSAAHPALPLSSQDMRDLQKGWLNHKIDLTGRKSLPKRKSKKSRKKKQSMLMPPSGETPVEHSSSEYDSDEDGEDSSLFITQQAKLKPRSASDPRFDEKAKNVSFFKTSIDSETPDEEEIAIQKVSRKNKPNKLVAQSATKNNKTLPNINSSKFRNKTGYSRTKGTNIMY